MVHKTYLWFVIPVFNCPVSLKQYCFCTFWRIILKIFASLNHDICYIGKIIVSSTYKLLHFVENINLCVVINHFKVSRFNDNDTVQQIWKLVLKVRLKNKIYFLTNSKAISLQKDCSILKTNCSILYLTVMYIFGTIGSDLIGMNFWNVRSNISIDIL